MSLRNVAQETIAICERGHYTAPSGRTVRIGSAQRAAVDGTRLYTPDVLHTLLYKPPTVPADHLRCG